MKCPYCARRVHTSVLDRRRPLRLLIPYCRACHRYLTRWWHIIVIALPVILGTLIFLEAC